MRLSHKRAHQAYVQTVASAGGVDGDGVPRGGRDSYVALHRVYKPDVVWPEPDADWAARTKAHLRELFAEFGLIRSVELSDEKECLARHDLERAREEAASQATQRGAAARACRPSRPLSEAPLPPRPPRRWRRPSTWRACGS